MSTKTSAFIEIRKFFILFILIAILSGPILSGDICLSPVFAQFSNIYLKTEFIKEICLACTILVNC